MFIIAEQGWTRKTFLVIVPGTRQDKQMKKDKIPPHHSEEIRSLASHVLSNDKSSAISKKLAASILGGSSHEEHPTPKRKGDK